MSSSSLPKGLRNAVIMPQIRLSRAAAAAILLAVLSASGCAKNVDRINFTKWGHSFVPRGSGMDTTAQGGAAQNGAIPQSADKKMPKASVGGTYQRTFATSPNYRMVGGFHVNPAQ